MDFCNILFFQTYVFYLFYQVLQFTIDYPVEIYGQLFVFALRLLVRFVRCPDRLSDIRERNIISELSAQMSGFARSRSV